MLNIKVKSAPKQDMTPQEWMEWYHQFQQSVKEVPSKLGRELLNLLLIVRDTARRKYLSGGGHSKTILNVRSGRLRSSIMVKILQNLSRLVGSIGTSVKYAGVHEFGGTYTVKAHYRTITKVFGRSIAAKRIFINSYMMTMPKRSFLKPAIEDNLRLISMRLEKLGVILQ